MKNQKINYRLFRTLSYLLVVVLCLTSISLLIIKNTKTSNALQFDNVYTHSSTPFSPTQVYYEEVLGSSDYRFVTINGLVLELQVGLSNTSFYSVAPIVYYYYGDPSSSTTYSSFVPYFIYGDDTNPFHYFNRGIVIDAFSITILGMGNNTIKLTFTTYAHVGINSPTAYYVGEVDIVLDRSTSSANNALYQFLTTAYPSTYYYTMSSVPTRYGAGTYEQGYANGQADAIAANKDTWYNNGYNAGINANLEEELGPLLVDETISAIITAPVNFIKQVFNFDLFGFNVGGIFFGIATITLLIVAFGIIKKVVK